MKKTNPKFAGLTDKQRLLVLEKVASTIDLACDICRSEAIRHGDHDAVLAFHALEHMLTGAGALADMASGSDVIGDIYDWQCGPNFHTRDSAKNVRWGEA